MDSEPPSPLIGVVGPCGAGKTTLIRGLEKSGYRCRHIAQEHSHVKAMWKILSKPAVLIYLHCSFENSTKRRNLNWQVSDYEEQLARLSHARENADLRINTDGLTPEEVLMCALAHLETLLEHR